MARPTPRDSVALMDGYHSPQLDVTVRLNTNEAPEPPPAEFVESLREQIAGIEWHRYPDRSATALRMRIAELEGPLVGPTIDAANVFVANGSNEVLQTLCLTYGGPERKALSNEPTYALHQHIAKITGTGSIEVERLENFELDLPALLGAIESERPEIVFLCSPNNPTGMVEDRDTVETVLAAVEAVDGLLVVDEAYGQFAPWSALSLVGEDRSIVVTRTFSKTWSAAGLRLGYLIGPTWVISELEKVVLPYHLDSMKQLAGNLALDYRAEMDQRVASLVEERGRVEAALADLPVDQWPSGANFILFRPRDRDGDDVWAELVERSVLVRNCSSWPRLDGCLRVTLGTRAEDDEFLKSLAEVLSS